VKIEALGVRLRARKLGIGDRGPLGNALSVAKLASPSCGMAVKAPEVSINQRVGEKVSALLQS
jgi:hypothetical protein